MHLHLDRKNVSAVNNQDAEPIGLYFAGDLVVKGKQLMA